MGRAIRSIALGLAVVSVAGTLSAQVGAPAQKKGISITPYIGVLIPTADLYSFSSGGVTDTTRISVGLTFGGRLGIGLGKRIGIEGDVGYSPGSVDFSSGGGTSTTTFNQDVRILSGSGRLTVYLIPRTSPVWIGLSGGMGFTRHTFKTGTTGVPNVKAGTDVGGVLGAGAGFRIGRLIALSIGAEDYLYNASFDVNGTKTAERKQHDIRVTGGIRVPFLGF